MRHISRHFMRSTIADLTLKLAAIEKSLSVKTHALTRDRRTIRDIERDTVVRERVINALKLKLAELMNDETGASVFVHDAWASAEEDVPFERVRRASRKTRKVAKRVRTATTTVRAKRATASA